MIYSKHDINEIEKTMKYIVDLIHFDVNDDLFVWAFKTSHLDTLKEYERHKKIKMMKTYWPNQIETNGLIFTIQSTYLRRKQNEKIKSVFEKIKNENPDVFFDVVIKNEKFDVFFVGIKSNNKIETIDESIQQI
jgi:pentose-5-phosphate-3-epimerase